MACSVYNGFYYHKSNNFTTSERRVTEFAQFPAYFFFRKQKQ